MGEVRQRGHRRHDHQRRGRKAASSSNRMDHIRRARGDESSSNRNRHRRRDRRPPIYSNRIRTPPMGSTSVVICGVSAPRPASASVATRDAHPAHHRRRISKDRQSLITRQRRQSPFHKHNISRGARPKGSYVVRNRHQRADREAKTRGKEITGLDVITPQCLNVKNPNIRLSPKICGEQSSRTTSVMVAFIAEAAASPLDVVG